MAGNSKRSLPSSLTQIVNQNANGINLFDLSTLWDQINRRKRALRYQHERMDYWYSMYLLYDAFQENKRVGLRRFISNEPMTAVDTSHRVISRFGPQYNVAWDYVSDTMPEDEELYGHVERMLYGITEDWDDDLVNRGEYQSRKMAAYDALLRGMIVNKVHLTEMAERDSGCVYVRYDPRFVLPTFNTKGLSSIICETPMTVAEAAYQYPDHIPDAWNVDATISKFEVWTLDRYGVCFIGGPGAGGGSNLVMQGGGSNGNLGGRTALWCVGPFNHNAKDTLGRIPFNLLYVNGVMMGSKPRAGSASVVRNESPQELRRQLRSPSMGWRVSNDPHAERGRSILASIETHFPQMNEAVSTLWQSVANDTFGVWFLKTRGGQVAEEVAEAIGTGGVVGGEPSDELQRFQPQPMNPAAVQFMQIVAEQTQKGTISAVLQALGEFRSGFLQARMEAVALTALEPFINAMNLWATRNGQLVVDQMASGSLNDKKLSLYYSQPDSPIGRPTGSFFRVEFDPSMLKDQRVLVKAEIEPSLPADMMERATIANLLYNNRRPLMSRSTIQERIIKIADPVKENERIWEDIAETDPVVIMEQIASALERRGRTEEAKLFRDRQMMALVLEMAQRMQIQAALGGGAGGGMGGGNGLGQLMTQGNEGAGEGVRPSEQPPEIRGEGAGTGGRQQY